MDVHSKVAAAHTAPRICEKHERPDIPAVAREAEPERVARTLGGQWQERGKIGIAADHPIQRDNVGGLEGGSDGAEISVDEFDLARVSDACGFLSSDVDEGLRSVDVYSAGKALAEQFVMDDSDATANVQDSRASPWPLTQCAQQSTCGWLRTTASIAAKVLLGSRAIELVFDTAALT